MLIFPFAVFLLCCSIVLRVLFFFLMFHSTYWVFWVSRDYNILRDIAPLNLSCQRQATSQSCSYLILLTQDAL